MARTVDSYISKLSGKPGIGSSKATNNNKKSTATAATKTGADGVLYNSFMSMDDVYGLKAATSADIMAADEGDDEGLTLLVPDLQLTERLVKVTLLMCFL